MVKKRKSHFKRLALVTACGTFIVVFSTVFVSQYIRLRDLNAQRAALTQELKELELEEQRLKLLASYVVGKEFASDYVRHELGYLDPNEIILHVDK